MQYTARPCGTGYTGSVALKWLIVAGVLIASLSPLFTLSRLFQMKEWRWDRLHEHVRMEGWLHILFGRRRATIAIAYAFWMFLIVAINLRGPNLKTIDIVFLSFLGFLVAFAILSVSQLVMPGKQRMPVWTAKTALLVLTSLLLTALAAWFMLPNASIIALPLLSTVQSLLLLASWMLWKPVDWTLKHALLWRAAARRRTLKDATVIGIVGSVGKTTTKELLKCVLQDLSPIATPEHVNTELGVASWLLKHVPAHAEKPLLVVEMGAYRKGEIRTLCRVAQPTMAVVTALGSDHLALFKTEEAIVEANAEILESLPEDGRVFLFGDNERSAGLASRTALPAAVAHASDVQNVRDTDRGLSFEAYGTRFAVALHGRHNVGNVALALAVAVSLGIKPERLRELLAGFRGSTRTFHLRTERGIQILDDTYNVSPLSFRAALDWAKERPERPRVLLTSGLLETGPRENDFLHEFGVLAKDSIERAIFTTSRGASSFTQGFGTLAEILRDDTPRIPDDSLLLCVGRMPPSVIQAVLPVDER